MIYAIRNDGYGFQELHLEVDDFIDNFPEEVGFREAQDFSQENLSMFDWWKPINTYFAPIEKNTDAPIPDVAKWINATLVLSPKAFAAIGGVLASNGELLPINISGQTYYIFNCLEMVEIDHSRSEKKYYEGEEIGWKTISFDSSESETSVIFKSLDQGCLDLFCGEVLKKLVEKNELKGVIFDKELVRNFD